MPLPKSTLQLLALTTRVRKGCKNPGKVKGKIKQIKQNQSRLNWLGQ